MILEHYEIIGDDKIVLSKTELESLLEHYRDVVKKYYETGSFYNVMFYNGKVSLLIDIFKMFEKQEG